MPSALPGYYEKFVEEVKAAVPADNLLIFNAKDGWGPLCDFLSPQAESIRLKCEQMIASGQPYPHVNDTATFLMIVSFMEAIALACKALMVLLFATIVRWWHSNRINALKKVD